MGEGREERKGISYFRKGMELLSFIQIDGSMIERKKTLRERDIHKPSYAPRLSIHHLHRRGQFIQYNGCLTLSSTLA